MIATKKHIFDITVYHHGTKATMWNKENAHCHHIVKVSVGDDYIEYDFWASIARPEVVLDDLPHILQMIGDNLLDAELDWKSFCYEFGYNDDSIKDYQIWTKIQQIYKETKEFLRRQKVKYTVKQFAELLSEDKILKKYLPNKRPKRLGRFQTRWSKTWNKWQIFENRINIYKEFDEVEDAVKWMEENHNEEK